jgi:SPP1 family holin
MKKFNLSGVSTSVIVRAVMTVILAINIILGYLGWHIIPLSEGEVGSIVDGGIVILTAVVWVWGWWKNNSFTVNAQIADAVLANLKAEDTDE